MQKFDSNRRYRKKIKKKNEHMWPWFFFKVTWKPKKNLNVKKTDQPGCQDQDLENLN